MKSSEQRIYLFSILALVSGFAAPLFADDPLPDVVLTGNNKYMDVSGTWDPDIPITSDSAAGLHYLVDGMTVYTPNDESFTAKCASLTVSGGTLSIYYGGNGNLDRTYIIPGLKLKNSTLIQARQKSLVVWDSLVTFEGNCTLQRGSFGYTPRMIFAQGIAGSGTLTVTSNGNDWQLENGVAGSYDGAIIFGSCSSATPSVNFKQPPGTIDYQFISGGSGGWKLTVGDGVLTASARSFLMNRSNAFLSLGGANTLTDFTLTSGIIEGSGTLTLNGETDGTVSVTQNGSWNLIKQGGNTLTVAGNGSERTGSTVVEAGTLVYASADAVSGGELTLSGGTADFTAYSGSAAIKTLHLTEGTLKLNPLSFLAISDAFSVASTGTLEYDLRGIETISARYILGTLPPGNYDFSDLNVALLSDGAVVQGSLIAEGSDLVLLVSGDAQTEFLWNVPAGIWSVNPADQPWVNRGSSDPVAFTDGAFVTFPDVGEDPGTVTVTLSGTPLPDAVIFNNAIQDYVLTGSDALAGEYSLTKKGAAVARIDAPFLLTGAISVQEGELALTQPPAELAQGIQLLPGTTLRLVSDTDITISGAVTGSGAIIKEGAGKLILAGAYDSGLGWVTDSEIRFNVPQGASQTLTGSFSGTGDYVKTGPGTLTVMSAGYAVDGVLRAAEGTLAFSTADRAFNVFKFDVTKVRKTGDNAGGFGISEIQLMLGDTVVNWPAGTTHAVQVNVGSVIRAYDNSTGVNNNEHKWYDGSATVNQSQTVTRRNALTLTTPVPLTVDGYRIWGTDRKSRDPVSWLFDAGMKNAAGTIDWLATETVTDAHHDANGQETASASYPPYNNNQGWMVHSATFPITITGLPSLTDRRFSVDAGATLDLSAAAGVVGGISGSGTVRLSATAQALGVVEVSGFTGTLSGKGTFEIHGTRPQTLELEAAETEITSRGEPVTLVVKSGLWSSAIAGNIRVVKTGETSATITQSNPNTYTGGTAVEGGSLTVAGSVSARYFRFAITDVRNNNTAATSVNSGLQLAELQPTRGGVRIVPDGWTITSSVLPATGTQSAAMLLDNDTNTKAHIGGKKGTPNDTTITIDFGDPLLFDGYCWYTANDCPNRDPVGWRVEVSNNGTEWTVIDEHTRAENLVEPIDWDTSSTANPTGAWHRFRQVGPFSLLGDSGQILPPGGAVTVAEGAELFCMAPQNLASLTGEGTLVLSRLAPETTIGDFDIAKVRFSVWPNVEKGDVLPAFSYTGISKKPMLLDAPVRWTLSPNSTTKTFELLYRNGIVILLY